MEGLNVDDMIAHLLVTEGFTSLETVAFVPVEELADIEGFDENLASELRERARTYLVERDEKLTVERRALGVEDALSEIDGVTPAMLVTLGKAEIKTLDDLGDLASDELREVFGEDELTPEDADRIIMAARAHWFEDEPAATEEETAEDAAGETTAPEGDAAASPDDDAASPDTEAS